VVVLPGDVVAGDVVGDVSLGELLQATPAISMDEASNQGSTVRERIFLRCHIGCAIRVVGDPFGYARTRVRS
jgi:hypothetical protein